MLVVKNKTAINLDAFKCFYYYDGDYDGDPDASLIFAEKGTADDETRCILHVKEPAQVWKEILVAYERGAKVYRIEEPI